MRKVKSTLTFAITLFCILASAQKSQPKFKFGDVKPEDFEPKVYAVDSSANAVYLYDVGSSTFQGNNNGWFDHVFIKHARIRLLNKNAFDLATVEIHLYGQGQNVEKLDDLDAATYNVENGKVVMTKVDKNSLFKDKSDDETVEKFTFPNLKEGSIIEYSYKIVSPYYHQINAWYFQGEYPRLWTQYSLETPQILDFITLKQGYIPYVIDSVKISANNYNIHVPGETAMESGHSVSVRSGTFYHVWAMQNVASLKEEGFTTTLDNHVAKIEFQYFATRMPDEPPKPYMQNWYDVAKDLMKDEDFGEPLSHENNWLDDDIKKLTSGSNTVEEKAKKIFVYVRDNFSCTDNYARYLSQTLKKTYQSKKGNIVDINILLAAMLKNAGLEVHPILLSTRERGKTYEQYPIMSKFNYVITQGINGDKQYLLDASNPNNGFNHLPAECYNGSARVIAETPVLINLSADSLKESKLTTVFMMNEENGLSGSFSTQLGEQESQHVRKKLSSMKQEDFFKEIKKSISHRNGT